MQIAGGLLIAVGVVSTVLALGPAGSSADQPHDAIPLSYRQRAVILMAFGFGLVLLGAGLVAR